MCVHLFNSRGWLDRSPADIQEHLEIFSGDIRDPYGVKKAMTGCDIVLHLAALVAIPYSYHSPEIKQLVKSLILEVIMKFLSVI